MSIPAPQINLITKRKKSFNRQAAAAIKAKVWSGTALVAYVVVMVLVMMVNVFYSARAKASQAALDRASMQLAANSLIVKQYLTVIDRSLALELLFAQRREAIALWQQLLQMLPTGTELTEFSIEGNVLHAGVKAPTVIFANQVVDMVEQRIAEMGVTMTVVGIDRGEDAGYVLTMQLTLPNIGKPKKS